MIYLIMPKVIKLNIKLKIEMESGRTISIRDA